MDHRYRQQTPGYSEYATGAIRGLFPTGADMLSASGIPGVSDAADVALLIDSLRKGNFGEAGILGAAAALPFVGASSFKQAAKKAPTFADFSRLDDYLEKANVLRTDNVQTQVLGVGKPWTPSEWVTTYPGFEGVDANTVLDLDNGFITTGLENASYLLKEGNVVPAGTGVGTVLVLKGMKEAQKHGKFAYKSDAIMSGQMKDIYERLKKAGVPFEFRDGSYVLPADTFASIDFDRIEQALQNHVLKKKGFPMVEEILSGAEK
jgi:hypothetical protein